MSKVAENQKGSPTNSHVILVGPSEKIAIKYSRLQAGDSFVTFYYLEKAEPNPSEKWNYIGRFFTTDPNLAPSGGHTWRPLRDAHGGGDPLRPRPHAWCLRFECFGSSLIREPGFNQKTFEIIPFVSQVLEIWPDSEYVFQFFRASGDQAVHTEVRILS